MFDIAQADALQLMKIEEDRMFFQRQREPGRPGHLCGVDKKLTDKEERARFRVVKEENRRIKYVSASKSSASYDPFISYGSVQPILTEYSGRKYQICAETSLYRLKRRPLAAALVLPECAENQENILIMIATGDECLYDSRRWSIQRDRVQFSTEHSLP
ncbi:hypothetical protein AVEN_12434-1 [Araneus ventricosus]|uniref:Uncharacterized protein n=1 Tax=Araneus ventricosus TaxID=182803 RepID=A0A4Y2TJK8_ARAVE|nr:hypothetical protein AVEN_12434-1 [Araneus ventricosus]